MCRRRLLKLRSRQEDEGQDQVKLRSRQEDEGQDQADQKRGHNREAEAESLLLNHDIAEQPAAPQLAKPRLDYPQDNNR
jgi:hypothetical protein